ncbi:Deoxyribodipyrimidine photo-lyase [Sinobacterium norvegicum]|uniref:Deoxyribodipyrimidine photo-lyase n=1 Tax=Sinobacterium norvegicum TaxID=1641715 RepID=A0ABN8EI06_9GAMM|nr:deoxyribodipyrimidine photo-lyase [Sinobacterium norvegicum]CAH0990987.1 Deoxyribodipyrimidine photo-lyase [Sinobacterium norvegicum]
MTDQKTIVWFRQDLRLRDNPALTHAVTQGQIIPVFILDEDAPEAAQLGGASQWWLHHSLQSLRTSLNNQLIIRRGSPLVILTELIDQFSADAVCWNRLYEPWQRQRDENIKTTLKSRGVEAKSFNGSLLWEPMTVLKKDDTPYKVFTPYYRRGCLSRMPPRFPVAKPETITFAEAINEDETALNALNLLPSIPWYRDIEAQWQPGEDGASQRLQRFVRTAAERYKDDRNIPAVKGTSLLSPHLHFGEMSPNQVWYAIHGTFGNAFDHPHTDVYLSELGWREFSYYLLFHWPDLQHKNFNAKFDRFPWRTDQADLEAWQQGRTGIPIVDAGMRELYQTGYMHNRVRMVVGSFLVKNLLIDWRHGERWFWDTLVDADMASNAASWQWVAGSGADASPYFRIFNPVLQGERFDTDGDYVKQYCPELQQLPKKYIHKPWQAPAEVLAACGIELGRNYPQPMVDLKVTRQRALEAFAQVKSTTNLSPDQLQQQG